MKVIATRPVFYNSKLWKEGEVFTLVERVGIKKDLKDDKKTTPHTFTVEEQFSSKSMKRLDPLEVTKDEGLKKRTRTKVESNNLEVI